jgi:hypothetical protein
LPYLIALTTCALLIGVRGCPMAAARSSAAAVGETYPAVLRSWTKPERWVWRRLCNGEPADLQGRSESRSRRVTFAFLIKHKHDSTVGSVPERHPHATRNNERTLRRDDRLKRCSGAKRGRARSLDIRCAGKPGTGATFQPELRWLSVQRQSAPFRGQSLGVSGSERRRDQNSRKGSVRAASAASTEMADREPARWQKLAGSTRLFAAVVRATSTSIRTAPRRASGNSRLDRVLRQVARAQACRN